MMELFDPSSHILSLIFQFLVDDENWKMFYFLLKDGSSSRNPFVSLISI